MAINIVNLANSSITSSGSFTTPVAVDVVAGHTYLLTVVLCSSANTSDAVSSVTTGNNTTWANKSGQVLTRTGFTKNWVFAGECSAGTTGATWLVNVSGSTSRNYIVIIDEVTGCLGTNAGVINTGIFQQDTTSPVTVTLATLQNVNNAVYSLVSVNSASAIPTLTNRTGITTIVSQTASPSGNLVIARTGWSLPGDKIITYTFTGTTPAAGLFGCELQLQTALTTDIALTTAQPSIAATIVTDGFDVAITTPQPAIAATLLWGPISDNFNRANEDPIIAPWASVTINPIRLVSNAAWRGVDNTYSLAYWGGSTWPANQYSQVIVPGPSAAAMDAGPAVRVTTGGNGYYYKVSTATLHRVVADTVATLATFSDPTPSTTLVYKLEIIGTTLSVYKNSVLLGSATSTTFANGRAGIYCGTNAGANVDNFLGGEAIQALENAVAAITTTSPTVVVVATQANSTADAAITTTQPAILATIIIAGTIPLDVSITTTKPTLSIVATQSNYTTSIILTAPKPTVAANAGAAADVVRAAITTSKPFLSIYVSTPQVYGNLTVQISTLIKDALTMLMVYSPDINLTADEEQSALRALNALMDSLANENLTINAVIKENFTLIGGQQAYAWMLGSPDFNSARPISIKACTVSISGQNGNTDMPVAIIQYDDYAAIKLKTLQTNYPQYVYLDGAWPANNALFYPVPSSAIPCSMYSYKPIGTFIDTSTTIDLPPGYYRMLVALLAVELAPSYQLEASQNMITIGLTAKKNIMRTNYKPLTMSTDSVLTQGGGRYNIFSDTRGGVN